MDGLVAQAETKGEIDFVEDFAAHVPGFVIGHLLGVPSAVAKSGKLRWQAEIGAILDYAGFAPPL